MASLEKTIKEKIALLEKSAPDMPAVVIVHDLRDLSVAYMSPSGLKKLGISMAALRAMGTEYNERYFNPEYAEGYIPKILALIERNNNEEVISYVQQVRSAPGDEWTWYMTGTKILLRDEAGKPLLIITNAVPLETGHFIDPAKATRLLEENAFLRKHHHLFDALTKREKQILKMMADGSSSAQIAEKLFISEKIAVTHRRNVKAKLKVQNQFEVMRFAQAFDLV